MMLCTAGKGKTGGACGVLDVLGMLPVRGGEHRGRKCRPPIPLRFCSLWTCPQVERTVVGVEYAVALVTRDGVPGVVEVLVVRGPDGDWFEVDGGARLDHVALVLLELVAA